MIYLQSTLWCCEKSLTHSNSLFIGMQKSNYEYVCLGVERGRLALIKSMQSAHARGSIQHAGNDVDSDLPSISPAALSWRSRRH